MTRGNVNVFKSQEYNSAFYGNLVICGNVWACPVCAAKIQERRRGEIAQAIEWAYSSGLTASMITLTIPHTITDRLKPLLERQAEALRRMRSGRRFQRFKERYGYQGLIRSLELTRGQNGWHPHTHELWFTDHLSELDQIEMKREILAMWENACVRHGILDPTDQKRVSAFRQHSVDIRFNADSSDYLAKQDDSRNWGVDREMSKGSSKTKGTHPFGILAKCDKRENKVLWLEYTDAIKGKRQLYWSRGLKDLVGLDEKDDSELAEESREKADLLGLLSANDWKLITSSSSQSAVLDAAENQGWEGIVVLLARLRRGGEPDPEQERSISAQELKQLSQLPLVSIQPSDRVALRYLIGQRDQQFPGSDARPPDSTHSLSP